MRAEEALRETNETLSTLIQSSPAAITIQDRNAQVAMWNPAAERIFGWSEQEVLGRPNPVIPEDKQAQSQATFTRVLQGNVSTDMELCAQRKDGSLIDVSLSTAPLRDATGEIIGGVGILVDITERVRAEEALHQAHNELARRVQELEDFHDLAVGRELKMEKMEEELEELKKLRIER